MVWGYAIFFATKVLGNNKSLVKYPQKRFDNMQVNKNVIDF